MILPKSFFLNTAKEKDIFYFSTDKISSTKKHYFICIKKSAKEILLFTCCTTQKEKREQYFKLKNYSLRTLVYINPTKENGLTEDTWVDCNNIFPFTTEEFKTFCDDGRIEFKGELSDIHYEQILIGLHESTEITNAQKLEIPNPDDII